MAGCRLAASAINSVLVSIADSEFRTIVISSFAVVTSAEIIYRENCVRAFEWRVRRKAQLEEDARNRELQIEREEQEHQQRVEQARIDRLLDEAASLRQAMDIRAYVDAVKGMVANETTSISAEKLERWSKWALAAAGRIDPVRNAHFIRTFEIDGDAN